MRNSIFIFGLALAATNCGPAGFTNISDPEAQKAADASPEASTGASTPDSKTPYNSENQTPEAPVGPVGEAPVEAPVGPVVEAPIGPVVEPIDKAVIPMTEGRSGMVISPETPVETKPENKPHSDVDICKTPGVNKKQVVSGNKNKASLQGVSGTVLEVGGNSNSVTMVLDQIATDQLCVIVTGNNNSVHLQLHSKVREIILHTKANSASVRITTNKDASLDIVTMPVTTGNRGHVKLDGEGKYPKL